MATCAQQFTDDSDGIDALNYWIEASNDFNDALNAINGDSDSDARDAANAAAGDALTRARDSFNAVAPHIKNNDDLQNYFAQVYIEFGELLAAGDLEATNNYMIDAYPEFRRLLGYPVTSK